MKHVVQKHISRPYSMVAFLALVFGLVMTGLLPVGNGFVVNAECTENGRFIAQYGAHCGGFQLFGMEHFIWHPRVTIAIGVMLLVMEALVWAVLAVTVLIAILSVMSSRRPTNPLVTAPRRVYGAAIVGILLTIHFAAMPVRSNLLSTPADDCAQSAAYCTPCPGVTPQATTIQPPFTDYGWPFHIVKKTYVTDACGQQPVLQTRTVDPLAALFNGVIWSYLAFALLSWLAQKPQWYGTAKK